MVRWWVRLQNMTYYFLMIMIVTVEVVIFT